MKTDALLFKWTPSSHTMTTPTLIGEYVIHDKLGCRRVITVHPIVQGAGSE